MADLAVEALDSAIRDHVIAFNNLGFCTFASCAGHEWAPADYPYISFIDYNVKIATAARHYGLDVRDCRDMKAQGYGYALAIYARNEGDTEGFVKALNALLQFLYVSKKVEDELFSKCFKENEQ